MLLVLLSWLYILIITLTTGLIINRLLGKLIPVPAPEDLRIHGVIVTGLVTLMVYAQTFSIFYKIGAVCHVIMLAGIITGAVVLKIRPWTFLNETLKSQGINPLKTDIIILLVLIGAFFTSRGEFHTDTGIYHAQTIRVLEEYGVIKGLGNLQLHFAYNSAYLALCALFTMSFILPQALHTMTGFFMVLFTGYALLGLFNFSEHKRHSGDFARIALLIYSFSNLTGLQSPATDYGTMFMTLYILCAWITYAVEQERDDKRDIAFYGYLAVLSIIVVSMKLSAATLVILALLPLVLLVKKKMWKELISFLIIGFLAFMPYLIRNVIISGWLFYPVASIDLFNVTWKIPVEYMNVDSAQIKVWGRCLYDITRINDGISTWLPIWWEEKQHYEQMLVYAQFLGAILLAVSSFARLKAKSAKPANLAVALFYITVIAGIGMWFFTAPFIRYGLAFLLLFPLCTLGDVADIFFKNHKAVTLVIIAAVSICFFSWIDNYFMDDLVFVKHHLTENYYLAPEPFEQSEMISVDMNGQTVYVSAGGEVNSYYVCPGTCYDFMAERTELIGSTIKEGFKAKDLSE